MNATDHRPPCVLSIAGSDSGGGAGIQADLKAFARCGVHGMTALTAVTAQNTVGVTAVHAVPPEAIVDQVVALVEDIGVDAVKIGMLGTVATIEAVGRALDLIDGDAPVVLDPVMVAESGALLLSEEAVAVLREGLLGRATVATPNVMEARTLLGAEPQRGASAAAATDELEELARGVQDLGPRAVVVTGGHAAEGADAFCMGDVVELLEGARQAGGASHGSGCTHSSALAAHLALGRTPLEAARRAKALAGEAIRNGLRGVGDGAGPVNVLGARAPAELA